MRILVVEDEASIAEGLRFNLTAEGYETTVAPDGETALSLLLTDQSQFDVVVLDVMLPGIDGFKVAQKMRQEGIYAPVLMLTARGSAEDVLHGFESGADDYLPKPFDLAIFLARIRGLLRRREWLKNERQTEKTPDAMFDINGKTIDFPNLEIRSDSETVRLTLMEAKLLRHLIEKIGQTVSRKEILEDVWELHEDTDTRAIDNFIVRLRRYLENDPTRPEHLLTVRGIGYRFVL
ncbi:MAG: response regulator transcription factor [Pyrinomonadaceae bacterium]